MSYQALDAIRKGDLERLRTELAENPDAATARDEQGVSLLLTALYFRQAEMVEAFLSRRDELDVFEAAALGHLEALVDRLDREPASLTSFSGDGFTPLHLAVFFGNERTTRLLLERGASVHQRAANGMAVLPINSAVAGGNVEVVRALLDAGADLEARQAGGFTPLMGAASGGRREIAELLLLRGARRESVADNGVTAAQLAKERGFTELAERLA